MKQKGVIWSFQAPWPSCSITHNHGVHARIRVICLIPVVLVTSLDGSQERIREISHMAAPPTGAAAPMRDVTHELARVTVSLRGYLERAGAPRGAGL